MTTYNTMRKKVLRLWPWRYFCCHKTSKRPFLFLHMARCNHILNVQPSPCTFFVQNTLPFRRNQSCTGPLGHTGPSEGSLHKELVCRHKTIVRWSFFFFSSFFFAEAIKAQKSPIHQPPLVFSPFPYSSVYFFLSYCPFFCVFLQPTFSGAISFAGTDSSL